MTGVYAVLERLFLFFKGYLIIELCGESKERFVNLCSNRAIEILHIFSFEDRWFCKIHCRDYKKIYPFIKKTGCCTKIQEKRGFPFLLKKMKKRKGLFVGAALAWLIISQCSGRIWDIEVQGGFLHTKEQILRVIKEELKVYGGVLSSGVDCFEIEKRLRLDYSEIGWISVERKGCRLSVMMNESVMPEQVDTMENPCHIVAERDGVVTRLEVLSGTPLVKAGDVVSKGDILISGIVPVVGDYDAFVRNNPVGARGAVWLESDFSYDALFPMSYEKKNFSEEKLGLEIFLFDQKLFSYIPRYSEGKYDIISIDIVPYAFDDYKAPVLLRKYRCMKYETEKVKLTTEEAQEKALALWNAFLTDWETQGVRITETEYVVEPQRTFCKINGTVKACGNFISYQEILEEEWNVENEHSGNNP